MLENLHNAKVARMLADAAARRDAEEYLTRALTSYQAANAEDNARRWAPERGIYYWPGGIYKGNAPSKEYLTASPEDRYFAPEPKPEGGYEDWMKNWKKGNYKKANLESIPEDVKAEYEGKAMAKALPMRVDGIIPPPLPSLPLPEMPAQTGKPQANYQIELKDYVDPSQFNGYYDRSKTPYLLEQPLPSTPLRPLRGDTWTGTQVEKKAAKGYKTV